MNPYTVQPFLVRHRDFLLCGDRWTTEGQLDEVLLLHGGGRQTSSAGFFLLRKALIANGIGSTAFDFVGHGNTGGMLENSSLVDRVAQAQAVIAEMKLGTKMPALIGFSMGAYVAIQLSALLPVRRLGLLIPAVYHPDAMDLPFGPQFSACIRQPESWQNSDAFELMKGFRGQLLVVSAEKDQVIPFPIPARLCVAAARAQSCVHHVIEGANHDLSTHYAAHPYSRFLTLRAILSLFADEADLRSPPGKGAEWRGQTSIIWKRESLAAPVEY